MVSRISTDKTAQPNLCHDELESGNTVTPVNTQRHLHNGSHVLQTADKEAGANCKNLSLHRGKPTIKQRFQTGSVDELCFLGAPSIIFLIVAVCDVVCGAFEYHSPVVICHGAPSLT